MNFEGSDQILRRYPPSVRTWRCLDSQESCVLLFFHNDNIILLKKGIYTMYASVCSPNGLCPYIHGALFLKVLPFALT